MEIFAVLFGWLFGQKDSVPKEPDGWYDPERPPLKNGEEMLLEELGYPHPEFSEKKWEELVKKQKQRLGLTE